MVKLGLSGAIVAFVLGVLASPAAAVIAPIATTSAPVAANGGYELKGRVYTYEADTTYRFEYGTTTAYGSSAPVPDADIGTQAIVDVSQLVTGLAPNTTYHFRIVAQNSGGTGTSPDGTFTTSEAAAPPGSGGPTTGGGSEGGGPTTSPAPGGTVHLGIVTAKGKRLLADSRGHTLYSLSVEKNGRFVCTEKSGCLGIWKPLLIPTGGSAKAPTGVKLGSVARPEGGRQATYRGLPLYTFVQDTKRGQTNGEGLKDVGTWHAVKLPKPRPKS